MRCPVNLRLNLVLEVTPEDGQTMPSDFELQEATQLAVTDALANLRVAGLLSEGIEEYLDNKVSIYQDYSEVKLPENQP